MANLAESAVGVDRTWYSGIKKEIVSKEVDVTLASMGTATNYLPAASFNLSVFVGLSYLTKSDNSEVIIGVPSFDGSKLLLKAADTNAPADFTGAYHGVVQGKLGA